MYLEDPSYTDFFDAPCDSINLLYDDTLITNPLHIVELDKQTWSIFPNPATDQVTIALNELPTQGILVVRDVTGKEIYRKVVRNNKSVLNISHWADGCYFFTYATKEQSLTHKFIKQ